MTPKQFKLIAVAFCALFLFSAGGMYYLYTELEYAQSRLDDAEMYISDLQSEVKDEVKWLKDSVATLENNDSETELQFLQLDIDKDVMKEGIERVDLNLQVEISAVEARVEAIENKLRIY